MLQKTYWIRDPTSSLGTASNNYWSFFLTDLVFHMGGSWYNKVNWDSEASIGGRKPSSREPGTVAQACTWASLLLRASFL